MAPAATVQAARPETYIASAAGRALDLTALSLPKVTLGVSSAKVTSLLTAVGEGVGSLGLVGTLQKAEVAGTGSSTLPENCAVPVPIAGIVNVGLACGSARASILDDNPVATGEGSVAAVDLNGQTLLDTVGPIPAVELPRTGGTPWPPLVGASVLGLAVLVRRVVAR